MNYRKVTLEEQELLKKQGCYSSQWEKVYVLDPFNIERIINVNFSGEIYIGVLEKKVKLNNDILRSSGLYNSSFHQCKIGDNVYISDVKKCSHYDIDRDVIMENVGSILVNGENTFGQGTELEVLNEGGGRTLKIFDKLSSQIAYFLVLYRHNTSLIKKLETFINNYISSKKSSQGFIGKNSQIQNTLQIINVNIGSSVIISGAIHLENGTIAGSDQDSVFVGEGVVAKNFIILSSSKIDSSAMLFNCFVGQGVRIGKQYSAENSVFFANCEGFHGEAVSIFAGPYTVTHHKSTLLIAGLFSFYNAGSGTNQSNHMYKLGPLHQGILERGSKTGSFSYLLWPCRIGAFSAIIGKHYSNFDTSEFPFSYITEDHGKSILTPAMNLFTVGTKRDSAKWPIRDRRKDSNKLDLIHFSLFNPYTVGKILNGYEVLNKLSQTASKEQEYVNYKGISIKRLMLKTCAKYYEMAIKIYMGQCLIERLGEISELKSLDDIKLKLRYDFKEDISEWLDICGLITPSLLMKELINNIEKDIIKNIDSLYDQIKIIYDRYKELDWIWCAQLIEKRVGTKIKSLTEEQIKQVIFDWKENAIKLNNMILKDAEKEFDNNSKIGFGIDGSEEVKNQDFIAVRGTYEDNNFIKEIKRDSKEIEKDAFELMRVIDKIK